MLTIDLDGARALLDLLNRIHQGKRTPDSSVQTALDADRFFVAYYCQWDGVTQENLTEAICRSAEPDWEPAVRVLAALRQGFEQAVEETDLLQEKLSFLRNVDTPALAGRVTPSPATANTAAVNHPHHDRQL